MGFGNPLLWAMVLGCFDIALSAGAKLGPSSPPQWVRLLLLGQAGAEPVATSAPGWGLFHGKVGKIRLGFFSAGKGAAIGVGRVRQSLPGLSPMFNQDQEG